MQPQFVRDVHGWLINLRNIVNLSPVRASCGGKNPINEPHRVSLVVPGEETDRENRYITVAELKRAGIE